MAGVIPITPQQALDAYAHEPAWTVIDVRPQAERALASIAQPHLTFDGDGLDAVLQLPRAAPLAFLCHHGIRSAQAAEYFVRAGFTRVHNIKGGIEAWALDADPAVPRY